ncbi:hypothetical protein [Daejeonia sp. YH14]|uniref:hypothetical protein n=1 Tax=Daejeonia sp. YH14 TaxID=3439042 RepID=UPI003F491359
MKKIFVGFMTLFTGTIFAQVAIGKSSVTNTSVSLEFGNENRGVIVPWVSSASTLVTAVPGTIVYDLSDQKLKIRYVSGWKDMSIRIGAITAQELSVQDGKTESTDAKVIIGPQDNGDNAPGILVLSATDKAMILPKVAKPYENIINPSPGTMAYDTISRKLCIFNGKQWTFWYAQ